MVAARKVRKVVCVVVQEGRSSSSFGPMSGSRFSGRPSDLLPWADPYIARLVHNLQEEIRQEMR